MKKSFKTKLIVVLALVGALLLGYGGYGLYNRMVEDITQKVRKSASKGVVDALNPFTWPGKIFGGGKKKD